VFKKADHMPRKLTEDEIQAIAAERSSKAQRKAQKEAEKLARGERLADARGIRVWQDGTIEVAQNFRWNTYKVEPSTRASLSVDGGTSQSQGWVYNRHTDSRSVSVIIESDSYYVICDVHRPAGTGKGMGQSLNDWSYSLDRAAAQKAVQAINNLAKNMQRLDKGSKEASTSE
jgi:hypothetical protein